MPDERSLAFRPQLRFNNGRPVPPDPNAPLKHVIDEYHHREQVVTCVCGWHGSTASHLGDRSAWDAHKAAFRLARP